MVKALFLLSTTIPTIFSIVPVSMWAFFTPFEPFWLLSVLFGWWLLFFFEPSALCCCMNSCLAVKSREHSHFNVSWIQVGERFVYVFIWLVEVWCRIKENKENKRKKRKRKKKKKYEKEGKEKEKKKNRKVLKNKTKRVE